MPDESTATTTWAQLTANSTSQCTVLAYLFVKSWGRGELPAQDNPGRQSRPASGFGVLVSSEDRPGVSAQVKTAIKFLAKHEKKLDRIKLWDVDNMK